MWFARVIAEGHNLYLYQYLNLLIGVLWDILTKTMTLFGPSIYQRFYLRFDIIEGFFTPCFSSGSFLLK